MKRRLFNLTEFIVRNIKGLQYLVADVRGLENQILWQKLNSFFAKKRAGSTLLYSRN